MAMLGLLLLVPSTARAADLSPAHANFPMNCLTCHDAHFDKDSTLLVQDLQALHVPLPADAKCFAGGCHTGTLADIHTGATTTVVGTQVASCRVCHAGNDIPTIKECVTCHAGKVDADGNVVAHGFDPAKHQASAAAAAIDTGLDDNDHWDGDGPFSVAANCSQCHVTALAPLHNNDCQTCHASTAPEVVAAIAGSVTACTACHTDGNYHQAAGTAHEAVYNAGNCSCHDNGVGGASVSVTNCGYCHTFPSVVDTIAPVSSSDATGSYVGPATVLLSAADLPAIGGSQVAHTYYYLDGGPQREGTQVDVPAPSIGLQPHHLEFWSVDGAGNTEALHKTADFSVSADTLPPTTASDVRPHYWVGPDYGDPPYWGYVTMGPDGGPFTGQQRTLSDIGLTLNFTATDNETQHATSTYVSLDGGTEATETSLFVPLSAIGPTHTLTYRSADYSGNREATHTASFSMSLDATPPVVVFNPLPTYTSPQQIPLSVTDTGGSGLRYFYNGSYLATAPAYISSDALGTGTHTYTYSAVDNVGNTTGVRSATWTYSPGPDTVPPMTTPSFLPTIGASYTSTRSVTLTATDGGSGVKATYWRVDAGGYSTGTTFTVGGEGVHTFSYYSTDNAGNKEATRTSNPFRIDTVAPVTASSVTSGQALVGTQTLTLTPADTGSGVAGTWWRLDGGSTWTSGTAVPVASPASGTATHTLDWFSRDVAGNTETTRTVSFTVAKAPGPLGAVSPVAPARASRVATPAESVLPTAGGTPVATDSPGLSRSP